MGRSGILSGARMASLIGRAAELFRAILHSPHASKRSAPLSCMFSLPLLVPDYLRLLIFAHILQRRCSTTPSVETPPTLPERSLGENGQLAYHQGNKRIMGRIDHRLHYFGLVWFGTTFLSLAPFLVPACLMVPPKYMAASVRTKLSAITCGVGWRRPQRVQKIGQQCAKRNNPGQASN